MSEITRMHWGQVLEITILEFFAYLSYFNYKKRKEEQAREEFRRKNKLKK